MRALMTLRRSADGTLMALGLIAASLFALFTGWLILDTMEDLARGRLSGLPHPQVLVGLAGTAGAIGIAGLGRLMLGRGVAL